MFPLSSVLKRSKPGILQTTSFGLATVSFSNVSGSGNSSSIGSSNLRMPTCLPQSPSKVATTSTARRCYNSLNCQTPFQLCFVRHGQSTWNRDNRFIGWTDTPLTDDGVLEARVAGQMLHKSGIFFDEAHTSLLRRSIRTVNLLLMEVGQEYIPVHKHWRLNERNYGNLVGLNKKETVKIYGKDQVKRWRRSYDEPPPPMNDDHPYHPARDPRYRLMLDQIPKTESLHDTMMRSRVYWDEVLAPALRAGKTILVVGHENNLRSIIMRLEGIGKDDIINLDLPRAVPLLYRLNPNTLQPLDRPDGKLDEATGMLRGHWLGGDGAVSEILQRDHNQVYNTKIAQNLEMGPSRDNWKRWMEFAVGPSSPEARAKAEENNMATPWSNNNNNNNNASGINSNNSSNSNSNSNSMSDPSYLDEEPTFKSAVGQ